MSTKIEPKVLQSLRCPICMKSGLTAAANDSELFCAQCKISYPVFGGRPVLLPPDNRASLEYRISAAPARSSIARFVPSPSINLSKRFALQKMRLSLDSRGICSILVVGCGHQRAWLTPMMRQARAHDLVYTDIDPKSDADIFCDAHDLPFADQTFDAVITTAVLEHVFDPGRVATEIARVLKSEGLLYSELPFIQQVHEGAYDFTRYTLSGHRRLLRQFTEIDAGMVAGPATALVWSIENFLLAFFAGKHSRLVVKAVTRTFFFWLKYFDYFLRKRLEALDGASCTFFLGFKSEVPVEDADIVRRYVGAKY